MTARPLPPIDLSRVTTIALGGRRSKVAARDLGSAPRKGISFRTFERGLPRILAADEFRALADAVAKAARARKTVLWMIGAHVVKTGLSPVLIELMRRRALTALATNGAGAIHDYEMALTGNTSEDVSAGLKDGTFGMARETGQFFARTLNRTRGAGFGMAVGEAIEVDRLKNRKLSLLASCRRFGLPATVHVAIGTDIIHQQPGMRGDLLGAASYEDFRTLCAVVATLEGGVVLNVGSAVILPEVFLKALTVARNLGYRVRKFTAANLDMIQHYRPRLNVVQRPTEMGGRRITLTGHHELLVPMLAQSILERL